MKLLPLGILESKDNLKKYKYIFDLLPVAVVIYEPDGKIIEVNERIMEWLGYSKQEVIRKNVFRLPFLDKENKKRIAEKFRHRSKNLTVLPYNLDFISKSGEKKIGKVEIRSLKNRKGKIYLEVALITNITGQIKAENQLKFTEQKYKTLFESSMDAIMILAPPDWNYIDANYAALNLFEIANYDDLPNLSPADLSPEFQYDGMNSKEKAEIMINEALKNGTNFFEWNHLSISGKKFQASLKLTKFDLNGRELIQATVRDITKEKEAERRLRESIKFSELIFELVPSAIFTVDKNKNIQKWNKRAEEITGYDSSDVIGKECTLFSLEPCSEKCGLYLDDIKKPVINKVCKIKDKYGNFKTILKNIEEIRDDSGNVIGGIESFEDITDNIEKQKALSESEELFRKISSSANDAIIMIDNKGNITFWNEAAEVIFKYSRGEVLGKNLHELLAPPEFLDEHRNSFRKFQKSGEGKAIGKTIELSARTKENSVIPIELSLSAILLKGKWCAVGIIRDISERKKAEEALKNQATFLQTLIDTIPSPIFYKDSNGRYIGCNTEFEKRVFGKPKTELLYKTVFDIAPMEMAQKYYDMDKELLETKETQNYESEVQYNDGTYHTIKFYKSTFNDSSGKVAGIVGIMLDISDLKEYEIKLVELNATKDKFFSIIAHDLRGPLGSMKNMASVLSDEIDTFNEHELRDFLFEIKKSSSATFDLLENLLIWSRSQRGKLEFDPEIFDINEVIKSVFDILSVQANEKKIEFDADLDKDIHLKADPRMIETIFRNLISNAIKYTPENGTIKIDSRRVYDEIIIDVSDTGVGIPGDKLEKLFRIDENYTTEGTSGEKGSGLGLILVKEFIEIHNGKITVESNEGIGTKFTITLPFQE